jgi:membrane protein
MSDRFRQLWEKEKEVARGVRDVARRLWHKSYEADILFLASGLAFNVLICLVPTLLLLFYLVGTWLQAEEANRLLNGILHMVFPNQPHAVAIREAISTVLGEIFTHSTSFGLISIAVLITTAASLFSSLRSVLNRMFQIQSQRHFFISYLVDLLLVLTMTLMILGVTTLNWVYRGLKSFQEFYPLAKVRESESFWFLGAFPEFTSIGIIFVLCFLLYMYVPERFIPRRTALISAFTTTLIWELSSRAFAWYLSTLTSFNKLYGAYAFILVLMLWVFYSCAIFVFGAAMGQVLQERREQRSLGKS